MPITHVGLVINTSLHYCRGVLRGIKSYSRTKPHWHIRWVNAELQALQALCRSPLDGVIAQVYLKSLVRPLTAIKRPVVNISRAHFDMPFPRVGVDEGPIGALAATHLLHRGFRTFAFVGSRDLDYSVKREAGFRRALAAAGHTPFCFHASSEMLHLTHSRPWSMDPKVRQWLADLTKPVGILAANDQTAFQLSEVCRDADLRVPEDVSFIGVDNDDLLCELARPSLSSVAVPAEQIGYEAAALLDRLLAGARPPRRPIVVPPIGVVVRQSSDIVAIDDPDVSAALHMIRTHAHVPLRVTDVLREVPVSRRSLELRFQHVLSRSLGEEIRRVHLERAKELLAGTDLSIAAVAEHAGFSDAKQLCVVFRQETGGTPTEYRRQFRNRVAGQ